MDDYYSAFPAKSASALGSASKWTTMMANLRFGGLLLFLSFSSILLFPFLFFSITILCLLLLFLQSLFLLPLFGYFLYFFIAEFRLRARRRRQGCDGDSWSGGEGMANPGSVRCVAHV